MTEDLAQPLSQAIVYMEECLYWANSLLNDEVRSLAMVCVCVWVGLGRVGWAGGVGGIPSLTIQEKVDSDS